MIIGFLAPTLSPAAGGLAASVPPLAHHLGRFDGVSPELLGLVDPTTPEAAQAWGPIVHAVRPCSPRAFKYAPELNKRLHASAPDITDVQGIWTYPSLVNFRYHRHTGKPYIVTPHGMLDPWARERSAWKKRVIRVWFEDAHLRGADCLRATAEMEAEHFRSFGLKNPIAIVPNGVEIPRLTPRPVSDGRRRLLFLSRIHPKKGLPFLLNAWAAIENDRPDWDLVIAGPDEVNHTAEMQALARRLSLKRVEWRSAVHGEAKSALYRSADLFVLPTHAENFGLVIAEALAHEVPVITTQNAPWSGLQDHDCGWWINLSEAELRATLEHATSLPREALNDMGACGRSWMERDFGWEGIAQQMLAVYEWVLGRGPRPNTVAT